MIRNFIQKNKIFFAIISFAVIAHIGVFFTLKALTVKFPHALHSSFPIAGGGFDGIQYPTLADNIISYHNFSLEPGGNGSPETFRTPGYPFFIAMIKYLTGTFDNVPIFQTILLILSAFLAYSIAISISPNYKTIGLIATGLFVFDPAIFFSTQFIVTESLYTFFLLLCLYFLIDKTRSETASYALAGVAFGLSAFVRPSGLYMIIPIVAWTVWQLFANGDKKKILRHIGIFCLTSLLILSPWFARNGLRTGVYAFSSLDAYNTINFNLPVYLSYKSGYKKSIEDIRADLHQKIGNISDEDQMKLKNSRMIKGVVWETLKPDLPGYAVFHIGKTANFFFSPGLKLSSGFLRGFWEGQPSESWHPGTSLVNSVIDGRIKDVFRWFYQNMIYIPESIFLLVMFVCGLYWYWKEIWRSDSVKLIFVTIFFLGLLTSPISNPRYRIPVMPLMYISGMEGLSLVIKKFKRGDTN